MFSSKGLFKAFPLRMEEPVTIPLHRALGPPLSSFQAKKRNLKATDPIEEGETVAMDRQT